MSLFKSLFFIELPTVSPIVLPIVLSIVLPIGLRGSQEYHKTRKMGGPWAPGALDHGSGPQGPGPKKNKEVFKIECFFQHRKDVRRNSVPKTVLNNSKSVLWSHSGAKTLIEKVSINATPFASPARWT